MLAERFGSYSIAALVSSALVARRDAALVVSPAGLLGGLNQALLGLRSRHLGEVRDGHVAAARAGRLELLGRHRAKPVPLQRSRSTRLRAAARSPSSSQRGGHGRDHAASALSAPG